MNEGNELQNLIEDLWTVGIVLPDVLDDDDYAVLSAIAKLLQLHKNRILNKTFSDSPIEIR